MLVSERGIYYLHVTPEERYNVVVKQGNLMRLNRPNKVPSKTIFKKKDEIKYDLYYEKMQCRITNKG